MVKHIAVFWLIFATSLAAQSFTLQDKIVSLVTPSVYQKHRALIEILFEDESGFYRSGKIDMPKVIKQLQDNRLLSLSLGGEREFKITFRSSANALFFTVLMSDILRDLGYQEYISIAAQKDALESVWQISMRSDIAMDPMLLQDELERRGAYIVDIDRYEDDDWRYEIDMSEARLNITPLAKSQTHKSKRLQYPIWLDVSAVKKVIFWSLKADTWYPYITFYDSSLELLQVYKKDRRSKRIALDVPEYATYIKIEDMHSKKGIKSGLKIVSK